MGTPLERMQRANANSCDVRSPGPEELPGVLDVPDVRDVRDVPDEAAGWLEVVEPLPANPEGPGFSGGGPGSVVPPDATGTVVGDGAVVPMCATELGDVLAHADRLNAAAATSTTSGAATRRRTGWLPGAHKAPRARAGRTSLPFIRCLLVLADVS